MGKYCFLLIAILFCMVGGCEVHIGGGGNGWYKSFGYEIVQVEADSKYLRKAEHDVKQALGYRVERDDNVTKWPGTSAGSKTWSSNSTGKKKMEASRGYSTFIMDTDGINCRIETIKLSGEPTLILIDTEGNSEAAMKVHNSLVNSLHGQGLKNKGH